MSQEDVQASHPVKEKESLPFSGENVPQQILGPDGKPCRACTDFKSWAQQMKGGNPGKAVPSMASANIDPNRTDRLQMSDAHSAQMNVTAAAAKDEFSATAPPKDCPVDKNELGRNTWSFLHTMAAYYPEEPTTKQQKDMNNFIKLFSRFYPCDWCSYHMRERLRTEDPNTSSNKALSLWFCDYHNEVNRRLGKKEFDCSKVFERWKDGWADGSCD